MFSAIIITIYYILISERVKSTCI